MACTPAPTTSRATPDSQPMVWAPSSAARTWAAACAWAPTPSSASWKAATARIHADLAVLLQQNRAFFGARGPQAVEERGKLSSAVEQFERDRIPEVEDAALQLSEPARIKVGEYVRQLRRLAADLKSKEVESSLTIEGLMERYRLPAIEREISPAAATN